MTGYLFFQLQFHTISWISFLSSQLHLKEISMLSRHFGIFDFLLTYDLTKFTTCSYNIQLKVSFFLPFKPHPGSEVPQRGQVGEDVSWVYSLSLLVLVTFTTVSYICSCYILPKILRRGKKVKQINGKLFQLVM